MSPDALADAARIIADLSRRNAHLAVLARVAELAGDATDLSAFFARASEVIRPVAGYAGYSLFVCDEAADELVRIHIDPSAPPLLEERSRRLPMASPVGDVVRKRSALVVGAPYQGDPTLVEAVPYRSIAVVPLVARSRGVGVIAAGFDGDVEVARGALELLSAVGAHFASAIESHGLLGDLRRRVGELTLLVDVARASAQLDPRLLLEGALHRVAATVGAEVAGAWLREGDRLALLSSLGMDPDCAASVADLGPGEGAPGLALERRTAVRTPAAEAFGFRAPAGACRAFRTAIAVPLLAKSDAVGALLFARRDGPTFGDGDAALLSSIGVQLGVAVEAARLHRETRDRAEQLALLHEVGRSLTQTLEIERLLEDGVRNLARIVSATGAHLWLVSDDGATIQCRAAASPHDRMRGATLPVSPPEDNFASRVIASREPLLIEDATRDPRARLDLVARAGGRGYLALPLVVHDRAIGAVVIFDGRGPRLFTPAEAERAAAVASQLAVAAENARLYEDLRRSYAELARAQQQLVQGERLAALGELSAVVAHEVRNPLGVIFNSLGSLRRLVRPVGDAKLLLDIVQEESERLNRIVGDLLDFARPSTPEIRPEELGRLAEDAVAAAVLPQTGRIEVVHELDPALPPVAVDARLVRQAVLNVAVNAVQAMTRGGRLTVRARRDGDAVVVELEDTGDGIPDEVRERIFEPFFTTKASGTGLGLAVVRRIVEGHGGEIRVRTGPGQGTTFALRFPLAPAAVENGPAMR